MKNPWLSRGIWWFWIYLFRLFGLPFHLSPLKLPQDEGKKLCDAVRGQDVLIIFHPGGWGDATIEQAGDFAPVLKGIQTTLTRLGYRAKAVPYTRTLSSLPGRLAGIREQYNSFKHNSQILTQEIHHLVECFPEKRFLIVGFSVGGSLSSRVMSQMDGSCHVYGIAVGVPGWFYSYRSNKSLVLDNSGNDPLCTGRSGTIAMAVAKAPAKWWKARRSGHKISIALAIQVPHHEYPWSSPEVSTPIIQFLENHFNHS